MLFCETGGTEMSDFDTLAVFASQARAHGLPVVISERSIPPGLRAAHQFDAAPFIASKGPEEGDRIILLGAQDLDQPRANDLQQLAAGKIMPSTAFGVFPSRQAEISVASRLAYALNEKPVIALPNQISDFPNADLPIFSAPPRANLREKPTLGLFFPDLSCPDARASIKRLRLCRRFSTEIVTNGTEKKNWIDLDGYDVPVWHLGEMLPRALAARFDIAVFFSEPIAWPRFQMLFANLVGQGAACVDATSRRSWQNGISEVISGPTRLSDLNDWLQEAILPNLTEIKQSLSISAICESFKLPETLREFQTMQPKVRRNKKPEKPSVLFVPTNGVGLGHAKRCSLVADAMRKDTRSQFAAFPSCIGMLTASGFDTMPLVSRTRHRASHDNDLVNFSRLSAAAQNAAVTVFDGGYVFDSVMRAAADNDRPSIWIRRGLWQDGQNNQVALDRQKTFSRIVVPTEAFDELNAPNETSDHIFQVGPIVQCHSWETSQRETLRESLQHEIGLEGKTLVVSMLGGGVAADRRAQINAICAHLEARDDVVHVLVVWPTATTDPGWFHYKNTRVVQSVHASALIPLADLFISAVGYNSFHEAIYGQVPTIFIPQMASFMDDQRARGKAAADREIAVLVEPWELLSLTQKIDECLAGKSETLRRNLRGLNLPAPGTTAASQHILEFV